MVGQRAQRQRLCADLSGRVSRDHQVVAAQSYPLRHSRRSGRCRARALSNVIAPGLAAISDTEAELLDEYVARGGHLITTGPTSGPAMLDGLGNARTSAGLRSLVAGKLSALSPQTSSAGTATHIPQPVGTSYLTSDPEEADRLMVESIGRFLHSPI